MQGSGSATLLPKSQGFLQVVVGGRVVVRDKPQRSLPPRTRACTMLSKGDLEPQSTAQTVIPNIGKDVHKACQVAKPRGGLQPHSQHLHRLPESAQISSYMIKLYPRVKLSWCLLGTAEGRETWPAHLWSARGASPGRGLFPRPCGQQIWECQSKMTSTDRRGC